jgi:glycosyltransferase involved in cell wall biosynthesis
LNIGIVTISYNQQRFLQEAINSVTSLANRGRLRYVVVDPGSADGSRELIAGNGSNIDRAILESDRGPADGLNKGFGACDDCEVLGYLNSDDLFAPGALDWVLEYFNCNTDVDVLLGAIAVIDQAGKRSPRSRVCDLFDLRRYAIGACNAFQQGTFFRRSAFERTGGFNIANRTCWDSELLVDLALAGARFHKTNRILGEFRVHGESITGSGRLTEQYLKDQERIRRKIQAAGVLPYAEWQATILRGLHRINPIRQASYLLAS